MVAAAIAALPSPPTSSLQHLEEPWQSLLQQFGEVAPPADQLPHPKHGVEHKITTAGQPVRSNFWRLDPEHLTAARAEFDAMLAAGIVRRSNRGWSSPLHMVRKKDGGWRPCSDFRRLNLITEPDRYPLPNMGDLSARLEGCKFFSKIDLCKGYLQVPVPAEDIPKTAVITPFGLFKFCRMPFSLRNEGRTF
jgi:hypothetical protein